MSLHKMIFWMKSFSVRIDELQLNEATSKIFKQNLNKK